MLDLDDPQFLAAASAIPLYERAQQYRRRSSAAIDLASQLYPRLDHARPGPQVLSIEKPSLWIATLIPPELSGISQAAECIANRQLPVSLTFHTIGARHTIGAGAHPLADARRPSQPSLIFSAIPPSLASRPAVRSWIQDSISAAATDHWDISATYNADSHPTTALLYLLVLVAYYCRTPLDLRLSDELLRRLQTYDVNTPAAANPAKRLALQLYARIPIFWGAQPGAGLAADCCLRYQWYAETAALSTDLWSLSRTHLMSRLPRYWPNTASFVQIVMPHSSSAVTAVDLGEDTTANEDENTLAASLHNILSRRNFPSRQLAFNADSLLLQCIHGLEFSEWLALYSATLYEIDPAARVPFQLLF